MCKHLWAVVAFYGCSGFVALVSEEAPDDLPRVIERHHESVLKKHKFRRHQDECTPLLVVERGGGGR